MINKTKKTLSVLVCILIIMFTAGYYYNKKTAGIKHDKGEKITAANLYKIFDLDVNLSKNYTGKIVEVNGEVSNFFKNQQNQQVIQLKSGKEGAFINCTMDESFFKVAKGDQVSIKGICNGIGNTDTILGIFGDVYLIRCYSTNSGK